MIVIIDHDQFGLGKFSNVVLRQLILFGLYKKNSFFLRKKLCM